MAPPRNVEDMYPLTPMQEGMLFHALYAPETGVYVQQVSARLSGTLDPLLFRRAWQDLVDRHPALRTAFEWERRSDPFQVVYRDVAVPWAEHDWSPDPEPVQMERLEALIAADRMQGFPLAQAPLLRVALIRLAADRWQVLWTHHHLILDGWSVPLLLRDLFALYGAAQNGHAATLEPRRPFREHVAWLRRQNRAAAQAFWAEALAGTELPPSLTGRPQGPARGFIGPLQHELLRLAPPETAALVAFARSHDLTLSTLLQGAWAIALARFSNGGEVLYGATVAGRPPDLPGAEQMVGLFINTVPVRAAVPPEAPALRWLREFQDRLVRQRAFEHTPLVDALRGVSHASARAALETLFVFENYPVDSASSTAVPGLALETADAIEQTDAAVTLVAVPGAELLLKIDFDAGRLDRPFARRLLDAVRNVLTAVVLAPERPLGALPVIGDAELAHLQAGNVTARSWGDDAFVHELIDWQADIRPDEAAIHDGDRVVTFAALRDRSDAAAAALAAMGIGPEARVGVELPRSAELLVAVLAVLKAGAAYVPLDPAHPAERVSFMAADAEVSVVISSRGSDGRYGDLPVIPLQRLDATAAERRTSPAGADGLAYVLYTSGSTGRPKGVMVTHRGFANYVRWAAEAYRAADGNGAPLHSPLGFDLTVTSVFPPLVAGRPVRIVPENDGLDALVRTLAAGPRFSLVKITPAHLDGLRALLPQGAAGGSTAAFVIGGEALTHEQLQHWRECAPGTRLVNEYGPTETVVGCAVYDAAGDVGGTGPVPIGRPVANTALYVLDRTLSPAPAGVVGELFVGGHGVARGYQGRPDLTAERFLPDPWSKTPGGRMYRTGDLASLRQDGELEFHGRNDDQIKIRGYRIEPGEVEAVLARHPGVREAAVVAVQTAPLAASEAQLGAFVVLEDGVDVDLRPWLHERLPAHLVPAVLRRVEHLPLTRNGKIDRVALARMHADRADAGSAYEPPRGPREELMALLWEDVLGRERVGRQDSFFDLGGHSLVATRLIAKVRRVLGRQIPLRAVFDHPTLADFAAYLAADAGVPPAAPIERRLPGSEVPLSLAQQRLWFLHELDPSSAAYNVPAAVYIDGPLQVEALRRALQQVVDRHDVLRTGIRNVDGRAVATVTDCALSFRVVDGTDTPVGRQPLDAAMAALEARVPFDLAASPLLRAVLFRLPAGLHLLLITAHHLVCDAWSIEVLVRETAASYIASGQGARSVALPLPVQYADVAQWQRDYLEGPAGAQLVAYWKAKLADLPSLDLPADRPPRVDGTLAGDSYQMPLDAAAVARLLALARTVQATPFMAFLAVFEVLLARYSGQQDFAVGTPAAGRDRPETEPLIGLFLNTLVLRSDVSSTAGFTELLRRVRETLLEAYAHQALPFERLVEAVQATRDPSRSPLVRVMFTTEHAPEAIELRGLRFTPVPIPTSFSKFDLTLSISEASDGWLATFEYRTELFDRETIVQIGRHYATLLAALAAEPTAPALTRRMLDAAEHSGAAGDWSGARVPPTGGVVLTVPELFARQAARTPQALAVLSDAETFTYAALDHRVERLARRLAPRGVTTDVIVGVCLERSVDLVVALLAVHRAGGAYAPLDPALPQNRIAMMLEDAADPLVLAHKATAARLPRAARVLMVDEEGDDAADGELVLAAAVPDSLAYVIYTSGSTGGPKGVMISHSALANHMAWMQRAYPLSSDDRVLQKTAASFDASVWEFFAPLLIGGTLALARPGGHADPDYLVRTVEELRVTILQVVPSMLRVLVDTPGFGQCASLRRVFAGGEALTATLVRDFVAVSRAELVNLYGPTEATIDSVVWTCDRDDAPDPVPIGRPIDNTMAYVLDERLDPVPPGVVGELHLGGAAIGRGYLNQPALTAERFVPDPFAAASGATMYRTGDRVRRRRSGVLEYLGRADGQVKLRGFRVELGEVERALESFATVRQALVVVREVSGRPQLVGYVISRAAESIDHTALRAHVQGRLPEYMVPAALVEMDAFPTLPSGKVDRGALPAPADRGSEGPYDEPRNPVEATLAAVWASVLGLRRVGIRDNFFTLGGDSILSLQVVARARAAGLAITPTQMFLHQTIESLAAVEGTAAAIPAPSAEPGADTVPLTPIQRWFFELPLAARHHWNQAILLRAPSGLDRAALDAALGDVVQRHDALQLRFTETSNGWRQERFATEPPIVEWVSLPEGAAQRDALEQAVRRVQGSIDLGRPPLLRAAWFDFGPDRPGRLLIVAHHLVIDGVSWRILLDDVALAYAARRAGEEPSLGAPTMSFAAWARQLAALAASGEGREEVDYWRAQVDPDACWIPLDADAGPSSNTEGSARHVDVVLPRDLTASLLTEAPLAYKTQVGDVLIAALVTSLAPWLGGRAITLELEGHGRELRDADASRTVGWFTALFPVRFETRAMQHPGELLKGVKERLRSVPRKGLGYGLLRYLSVPGTLDGPGVRPPVSFNYLGRWGGGGNGASDTPAEGLDFGPAPEEPAGMRAGAGLRTHPLEVVAAIADGQLRVRWTYSECLHKRDTIAHLADEYRRSLVALIEHCGQIGHGGHTPSDFTATELDQRQLDKLLAKLRGS